MFERHHVLLRDTLAALSTALRDALKRKIAVNTHCCTGFICTIYTLHDKCILFTDI